MEPLGHHLSPTATVLVGADTAEAQEHGARSFSTGCSSMLSWAGWRFCRSLFWYGALFAPTSREPALRLNPILNLAEPIFTSRVSNDFFASEGQFALLPLL